MYKSISILYELFVFLGNGCKNIISLKVEDIAWVKFYMIVYKYYNSHL